jgi:hypothetical protein
MKRNPSKSNYTKNKSGVVTQNSKKSSRMVKASSCVKINSLSSEQNITRQQNSSNPSILKPLAKH